MQSNLTPELLKFWKDEIEILWYLLYALISIGVGCVLIAITNLVIAFHREDYDDEPDADDPTDGTGAPRYSTFGKGSS